MAFSLLIVVPTLNSFSLLPRLLTSLQHQTWTDWQLLFVDGPSCPEHRNWLDRLCANDSRCRWIKQTHDSSGIFGAMNHGFAEASPDDWIIFLGSDDWFADPHVLSEAFEALDSSIEKEFLPDLLVCRGRYAAADTVALTRPSVFKRASLLSSDLFRRALFFGSTPPHQATLFGPGARRYLCSYSSDFLLSADLDYYLKLSRYPDLLVKCLDLELVHMLDSGISGQLTLRRLTEVARAYMRAFLWFWWVPFVLRYLLRLSSLFIKC